MSFIVAQSFFRRLVVTYAPRVDRFGPWQFSKAHEGQIAEIACSIEASSFTTSILVDKSHLIAAGHSRIRAAMRLGLFEAPVTSSRK